LRVQGSPHPLFLTVIYHSPQRKATLSVRVSIVADGKKNKKQRNEKRTGDFKSGDNPKKRAVP
jgi:hypothetical protein